MNSFLGGVMIDFSSLIDVDEIKDLPEWLKEASIGEEVSFNCIIIDNYVQKESGFCAYNVEDESGSAYFELSGLFPSFLISGQSYKIKGIVQEYKGRKQIRGFSATAIRPSSKIGIIAFLQTLKGLKMRAYDIYEKYGDDSLSVIVSTPEDVAESIKGIGLKSVMSWKEQIEEMDLNNESVIELLNMGIKIKDVHRLIRIYGTSVVEIIKENPYFLISKVKGFGFVRCDKIAIEHGVDLEKSERIQSGILHVLHEAKREGHCFLPKNDLIKKAVSLLGKALNYEQVTRLYEKMAKSGAANLSIPIGRSVIVVNREDVIKALDHFEKDKEFCLDLIKITQSRLEEEIINLMRENYVISQENRCYLKELFLAEETVAKKIVKLVKYREKAMGNHSEKEVRDVLNALLEEISVGLEEKQYQAVLEFSKGEGGIYVLNGGAGTGKTFTLNIILKLIERISKKKPTVSILAPTGRAAKVAAKSTGRTAMTIHRGLGLMEDGFLFNEDYQLPSDVVVVDETSMVDIELMSSLLQAISVNTKVIFIGDFRQLKSVGPGKVLIDMIDSETIPVVTLNVGKRQKEESGIISNAHRILEQKEIMTFEEQGDAYVLYRNNLTEIQKTLLASIQRLFDMGYDWGSIQILSPMNVGDLGVHALNYLIQKTFQVNYNGERILNKRIKIEDRQFDLYYQVGDKVLQTENNYGLIWHELKKDGNYVANSKEKGVMNGEIGVVHSIFYKKDEKGKSYPCMWVQFEDGFICYEKTFSSLDHAYVSTVHKTQGSQWPATILLLADQHSRMLDNSIAYTGYTRSSDFQLTLGTQRAITKAIKTVSTEVRHTHLKKRLQELALQ